MTIKKNQKKPVLLVEISEVKALHLKNNQNITAHVNNYWNRYIMLRKKSVLGSGWVKDCSLLINAQQPSYSVSANRPCLIKVPTQQKRITKHN